MYADANGSMLYAGGDFSWAGGEHRYGIAMWDGSYWNAMGNGMNGSVRSLTVFADANGPALYAGGGFTSIDSGEGNLAKWGPLLDTTPPTIHCPSSVLVGDRIGSRPGEVVSFTVRASDCQDPSPTVVCVPPSGSFFPRGKTLVHCTATDAVGNQSTCEFMVTVARGKKAP